MSAQPVNCGAPPCFDGVAGYYGKVPMAGDFVSRRVSRQTILIWDAWLRHGLHEMKKESTLPAGGARYDPATVWNFVVPPTVAREPLVGVIGASVDRVGRQFPFTLFMPFPEAPAPQLHLDRLAPFFVAHGPILQALRHALLDLEQLERALHQASDRQREAEAGGDIFSILNDPARTAPIGCVPWSELPLADIMRAERSYWWTNQVMDAPAKSFTHSGLLDDALFKSLFAADSAGLTSTDH